MKSIRPKGKRPDRKRVIDRVRTWTRTPTGCGTCNAVRRAAGKVVDKVAPPKR